MPDREVYDAMGAALAAAENVLLYSQVGLKGVLVIADLAGEGVIIAASQAVPADQVSTLLAEASWRAAGAGA